MENTITEQTKTFLIACLVTGIDVHYDKIDFMTGLASQINSGERIFWAQGDEDGIIIHDEMDQPILSIMYSGARMTFRTFGEDEFSAMDNQKNIGYVIINVISYIRSLGLDFCPSVLGSEASIARQGMELSDDTSDTDPDDWAL